MGRKKKSVSAEPPKKEEETVQAAPEIAPPPAPPSQNATVKIDESPAFLAAVKARAAEVAKECGLREPFMLTGPDRIDYPQRGHGYIVTIKEQTGKGRMGSARFNAEGEHRYWSMDGLITG